VSTLAFIPARGGSESIPLKNIHDLGGRPLIEWCMNAVVQCTSVNEIVCSTDSEDIAAVAHSYGIECTKRPPHMRGGKTYSIAEIVCEYIESLSHNPPDETVLIQPTSPFVTPGQINSSVRVLADLPQNEWQSAQTVCEVPHNYHPWNQRVMHGSDVTFRLPQERKTGFNKQRKPTVYKFGNVVAVRTKALLQNRDFFAGPSYGRLCDWIDAMDMDGPSDFDLGNMLIETGRVKWLDR
jgi:CMP-N,N'-diacetyllegionaminic acid synthase